MKTTKLMIKILVALGMLALCNLNAADEPVTPSPYEVVWDTPSADYNGTMPLGNGEIALNAWIEPSGDLRFYIARTDAWDDSGRLVKVGAMRIKVGDGSAERTKKFRQILTAKDGTLSARYGEGDAQVDLGAVKTVNAVVIENRLNERRAEGLILSLSEDGQKWEEIWRATTWESTWIVPVTHFDAGINAPGRRARFIRVETRNEAPRELLLRRITVFGVK